MKTLTNRLCPRCQAEILAWRQDGGTWKSPVFCRCCAALLLPRPLDFSAEFAIQPTNPHNVDLLANQPKRTVALREMRHRQGRI